MSGEADLWAAVFALAMKDACETESYACKAAGNSAAPTCRDALEAWAFLTHGGEWGAHREWLAGINGIQQGIIREEALRRGPTRGVRVARLNAEMREEKPVVRRVPRRVVRMDARARIVDREAMAEMVAADWAAGVEIAEIAKKTGFSLDAIPKIARRRGAMRPAGWMSRAARKASADAQARNAGRDAEIMRRRAEGERIRTIATDMGLKLRTVFAVISKAKSGSAVEAGGSNSRAAGGGGCSFHGQNMQDNG